MKNSLSSLDGMLLIANRTAGAKSDKRTVQKQNRRAHEMNPAVKTPSLLVLVRRTRLAGHALGSAVGRHRVRLLCTCCSFLELVASARGNRRHAGGSR
jgi:hypothetical protein